MRRGKVYLVYYRHDLQVVFYCEIGVGKGLRLYSLGSVNDEQSALARHQRTRHLVVEVHVTGGVDEVEDVVLAVVGVIFKTYCARLDGDAALALDVHVIKKLLLHIAEGNGLGLLQDSVGKGGFAVVDVCDDAEVAYLGKIASVSHVFVFLSVNY
ncbi:1-deoxy-D-xylulose 5-phosphate reductoisomerase [Eubacterium sp. CAG:786]|nr:1-deoxy-D-xylulose 5-phosphate reductoisomerase [Eubacterium sp. CAG:786]